MVCVPACVSVSVGVGLQRPKARAAYRVQPREEGPCRAPGPGGAPAHWKDRHLFQVAQATVITIPGTKSASVHLDPEQVEKGIDNVDLPF